jgi:hypothetical protein
VSTDGLKGFILQLHGLVAGDAAYFVGPEVNSQIQMYQICAHTGARSWVGYSMRRTYCRYQE